MGKPADPRIAEYAFVDRYNVFPNLHDKGTYYHYVAITYTLLDNKKEKITEKDINHCVLSDSNGKESIKKVNEKIHENIDEWIEKDKKDLTGYYPFCMLALNGKEKNEISDDSKI